MPLSEEIKNHYFDSFTNSYVTPTVEDKWQDAAFVMIWTFHFFGECASKNNELHRADVIFAKLPLTTISSALHAVVNMSLAVITTGGSGK